MKKRAFGLDILRATAILLVIFAHMTIPFKTGIHSKFWDAISAQTGLLGVELFFVLSGFLIGTILIKLFNKDEKYNIKQIKDFWIRRWFRTLPNYYLVLILVIFIYYYIYGKIDLSWIYFVFLKAPDYLAVAWSLIVEEWFYLLFPLLLLCIAKISKKKYVSLLITICLIIIIPILLRIYLLKFPSSFNFIITFSYFDSIGIGALSGFLYYYHEELYNNHKKELFMIGLLLFFISVMGLFFFNVNPTGLLQWGRIINILVLNFSTLFMIPWLYEMNPPKNKILFSLITYISLISYSLYLTHTAIIEIFYNTNHYMLNISNGYIKSFISLTLVFSLSAVLYHFFEKPMTALREK